jgi:hypothetical protein
MIEPARLPLYIQASSQAKSLSWSQDAKTLVARLGTHKGRLPQGSPLSPLLANVAFSPFDSAICEIFGSEFGRGQWRFTRYFDDLTISISKNAAEHRRLKTPREVKLHCERLLTGILRNSSYRLNSRKSRCSTLAVGHDVTGLMVRNSEVDLPRRLKRYLRSTIHNLKNCDFVELAKAWYASHRETQPAFESISRGHRWPHMHLRRRRISAERLATLMLRHIYPDLRLERLLLDWYPWQEILSESDEGIISNRPAWKMVEWLLAALWSGSVVPRAVGSRDRNYVEFQQAGVSVCKVLAESPLDFFRLTKDSAIAMAEFWHHLQGLRAYLKSCPSEETFKKIHKWRDNLEDALHGISWRVTSVSHAVLDNLGGQPDTTSDRIGKRLDTVEAQYREFSRLIHVGADGRLLMRFKHCVPQIPFEDWIDVVAELFVTRLTRLPHVPAAGSRTIPSEQLFEYLRVKRDQTRKRISPHYRIVDEVDKLLGIQKTTPNAHLNAQYHILTELCRYFEKSTELRRDLEGRPEEWLEQLALNPWHRQPDERISTVVDQLEQLYGDLRSSSLETRLFVEKGADVLGAKRELLVECRLESTSDDTWEHLTRVSLVLYKALYENIEPTIWPGDPSEKEKESVPNVNDWRRRRIWTHLMPAEQSDAKVSLKLIENMRHRESHGETADRRKEWLGIQRRVRDILGRKWESKAGPNHPEFRADCDLELSGYEGAIVKLHLLCAVESWLTRLINEKAWRISK